MGTKINLAGQRFGRFIATDRYEIRNRSKYQLCLCDCGNQKWVFAGNLTNGKSKSCGCGHQESVRKPRPTMVKILAGQRFGRLLVTDHYRRQGKNRKYIHWLCICDCGSQKWVLAINLRSGTTNSCGCLMREHYDKGPRTTHGNTRNKKVTPEFGSWTAMRDRCSRPNNDSFQHYGGRGITVCDRWQNSFENFLADMGPRPAGNYSLDRIDVNGNYCPENCKWETAKNQALNRRPFVFVRFTPAEKALLATKAAAQKISVSTYLRNLAFSQVTVNAN